MKNSSATPKNGRLVPLFAFSSFRGSSRESQDATRHEARHSIDAPIRVSVTRVYRTRDRYVRRAPAKRGRETRRDAPSSVVISFRSDREDASLCHPPWVCERLRFPWEEEKSSGLRTGEMVIYR